jgi:hypothetical protein
VFPPKRSARYIELLSDEEEDFTNVFKKKSVTEKI